MVKSHGERRLGRWVEFEDVQGSSCENGVNVQKWSLEPSGVDEGNC